MKMEVQLNSTSVLTGDIFVQDSSSTTGAGLTGLVFNTSSLTGYYHPQGASSATAISLVTATLGTWTSGGFIVVDGTHAPGLYQLMLPNACFTALGQVTVYLFGATNMAPVVLEIQVVAYNPNDAVRLGLTALPNANAGASGGLPVIGTGSNNFKSNSSANVTADVTSINSVSAASVTVVGANVGTTQPVNFTGTGASALAKSDMVNIAGAAVSASTPQIGVNVVNFGGSAGTFSSGKPAVTLASTDVSGNVAADLQTIKTQTVTCPGGVTVPAATLASTTNITAGTITTTTNLTNAPTAGDFTATMKTSLNAATPASVTGTVGGIAGTTQTLDALQTALNSTHGAGSWATATGFSTFDPSITGVFLTMGYGSALVAAIAAQVTTDHGVGSYLTATGFAVPGDTMKQDMTQGVPTTNTPQTVGDAHNASRAQGFGKWAIVGTTLNLYAADGTTVVRAFLLDSATAPTSRT